MSIEHAARKHIRHGSMAVSDVQNTIFEVISQIFPIMYRFRGVGALCKNRYKNAPIVGIHILYCCVFGQHNIILKLNQKFEIRNKNKY